MKEHTARSWLETAEETMDDWLKQFNVNGSQINLSSDEQIRVIVSCSILSMARSFVDANEE